jgi:HlyD family secretion protein
MVANLSLFVALCSYGLITSAGMALSENGQFARCNALIIKYCCKNFFIMLILRQKKFNRIMDKQIDKNTLRREAARRYAKWIVGAGVVAAGIVALLMSLQKSVYERDLTFGDVTEGPLDTSVSASGKVVPAFEEIINSPVDSRIVAVYAQAGDSVVAGTPLLELDLQSAQTDYAKKLDERSIKQNDIKRENLSNATALSELTMQIKVKEMEVQRLAVELTNERRLDSLGSGTGERVRQAETSLSTGRLELEQLRSRLANERQISSAAKQSRALELSVFDKDLELMRRTLADGKIPAPHSGVLTYISSEIGSRVSPGQKVAVVSDLSRFKIEGQLPDGSRDRIAVGAKVLINIGKEVLEGTVTNISPQSNQNLISFNASLADPRNPRLRPGLSIEMQILYGYKNNVVLMPNGTFFKGPGQYDLFVFTGERQLERRSVKLGDSNREYIEVLSGLKPGDRVVTSDMSEYSKSKNLKLKTK